MKPIWSRTPALLTAASAALRPAGLAPSVFRREYPCQRLRPLRWRGRGTCPESRSEPLRGPQPSISSRLENELSTSSSAATCRARSADASATATRCASGTRRRIFSACRLPISPTPRTPTRSFAATIPPKYLTALIFQPVLRITGLLRPRARKIVPACSVGYQWNVPQIAVKALANTDPSGRL